MEKCEMLTFDCVNQTLAKRGMKDLASDAMLSRFDASFITLFGTCSEPLLSFYLDTLLLS